MQQEFCLRNGIQLYMQGKNFIPCECEMAFSYTCKLKVSFLDQRTSFAKSECDLSQIRVNETDM